MTQRKRLLQALANILPAGALGASALLACASPVVAASVQQSSEANPALGSVSLRLAQIRAGVTELTRTATADPQGAGAAVGGEAADPLATPSWWGNGGFGRWRLGWGNGGGWRNGWHNGGWGNGGWGNGWHNGGWGNGWHNGWGNGWHNG